MDTSGLDLTDADGGCRIPLRVKPSAKQDTLIGPHGGRLKMTVVAPPEKGKANRQVLSLLAKTFGLAASSVSLVHGETSPDKVARLELGAAETRARWVASRESRD